MFALNIFRKVNKKTIMQDILPNQQSAISAWKAF